LISPDSSISRITQEISGNISKINDLRCFTASLCITRNSPLITLNSAFPLQPNIKEQTPKRHTQTTIPHVIGNASTNIQLFFADAFAESLEKKMNSRLETSEGLKKALTKWPGSDKGWG
jgi:hypothetical protein